MVTVLHHMVHMDSMTNTNVWDICVQCCSSCQTFGLPWEYTTKQKKPNNHQPTNPPQPKPKTNIKPQKRETVFLQAGLAQDSIHLLNWTVLPNIHFTGALTGFSNCYAAMSWTGRTPPKDKEPLPQESVITAEEVTTQLKAE